MIDIPTDPIIVAELILQKTLETILWQNDILPELPQEEAIITDDGSL